MAITSYGFTLTVDLHGMTVTEARSELLRVLKSCPKHIKEIDVIMVIQKDKPSKSHKT